MLEIALTREDPWADIDWDALAARAARAAIERTPHGELLTSAAAVEVSVRLTSDDQRLVLSDDPARSDRHRQPEF
jgi:probable rRNA maturation factor